MSFKIRKQHNTDEDYIKYLEGLILDEIRVDNVVEYDIFEKLDILKKERTFEEVIPNNLVEYAIERRKILFEERNTLEYMFTDLRKKYKLEPIPINPYDLYFCKYYLYFLKVERSIPSFFYKYFKGDVTFYEINYIRVKCAKNGIAPVTIERLINRYFKIGLDQKRIDFHYFCINYFIFNTVNIEHFNKRGRKSLPQEVRELCKTYLNKKNIERVKKYKEKASLFTFTEWRIIEESVVKNIDLTLDQRNRFVEKINIILK